MIYKNFILSLKQIILTYNLKTIPVLLTTADIFSGK